MVSAEVYGGKRVDSTGERKEYCFVLEDEGWFTVR